MQEFRSFVCWITLVFVCSGLAVANTSAAQQTPSASESALGEAKRLVAARDLDRASDILADVLELAQQAYAKELELSPNNPIATYNLAKIDIETNRSAEGLDLLRKVTANYANVPATWFYQGLGEFDTGNTDAALAALEKARSMHPEPELAPRIEYELSRVYRKLGRVDDANHAIHEYTRMREQNAKLNPAVLSAISSGFGSAEVPAAGSKNKN